MDIFAGLPSWAVVLLGLIAAALLIVLNLGWLLSAKAMLEGRQKRPKSKTEGRTSDDVVG